MKKNAGEEFLNKIYRDLYKSDIVRSTGKGGNKNEDVAIYLNRLENVTNDSLEHNHFNYLKKLYHDKYVIKPDDVPDSYFKLQQRIALERGFGHLEYNEDMKREEVKRIIKEQEDSLDIWIDYFASNDVDVYPTWFKYFCFQGMIRLGYFDKESGKFTKRTKSTVKPFIELNPEAIGFIYEQLIKVLDKRELNDREIENILKSGSFANIYAYIINKLDAIKKDDTNSKDGIWKKYERGSNPKVLFDDINGKGTGWCTAGGISTAKQHLSEGDFYVYYTKDKEGRFANPRIAIRMSGYSIAEIRGVAEGQNLENSMEEVVEEKLDDFSDGDRYRKKVSDMHMLTEIYNKVDNENLSIDELVFLYQIKENIYGFGFGEDPRIKEIIEKRNQVEDLKLIFESGKIKEVNKSLDLSTLKDGEGLEFPDVINGDLNLSGLNSLKGVKLPKVVNGNLILSGLETVEGLEFPEIVKGSLDLSNVKNINNFEFPYEVYGDLNLSNLEECENLILPEIINGNFTLASLTNINNVRLPRVVKGSLALTDLESVEGLKLPEYIGADLYLSNVKSISNFEFPKTINGILDVISLEEAYNVKFPESVGVELNAFRLKKAVNVIFPKSVVWCLRIASLEEVDNVIIPDDLHCRLEAINFNNDINQLRDACKKNNNSYK